MNFKAISNFLILFVMPALLLEAVALDAREPDLERVEAVYEKMRRANQPAEGRSLSALTFNVGLLNSPFASVPHYKARSGIIWNELKSFIEDQEVDFIFLQELWYESDLKTLLSMAEESAYLVLIEDSRIISTYGLQILVRKDILKGPESVEWKIVNYMDANGQMIRAWFERMGNINRGVVLAEINLDDGQEILLANTHLTATLSENETRKKQLENLGVILKEAGEKRAIVLGADFNVSPEFSDAIEREVESWEANTESYVFFFEQSGLLDAYATIGADMPGWTQDRKRNSLTAESKSTKIEPEQRLDYIWLGGSGVFVEEASLVFVEPVPSGDASLGDIYLSDHFGVYTKFTLAD